MKPYYEDEAVTLHHGVDRGIRQSAQGLVALAEAREGK